MPLQQSAALCLCCFEGPLPYHGCLCVPDCAASSPNGVELLFDLSGAYMASYQLISHAELDWLGYSAALKSRARRQRWLHILYIDRQVMLTDTYVVCCIFATVTESVPRAVP